MCCFFAFSLIFLRDMYKHCNALSRHAMCCCFSPTMYAIHVYHVSQWVSNVFIFKRLLSYLLSFGACCHVAMCVVSLPSLSFSPRHEHEHCPGTPCAAAAVVSHRQECVQFKGGNGAALGVTMKFEKTSF